MIVLLLRVAAVFVFCLAAATVTLGDVPPVALGLALFAASFLPWDSAPWATAPRRQPPA